MNGDAPRDAGERRRFRRPLTFGPIVALLLTTLAFGAADQLRNGARANFLSVGNIAGMSTQTVVVATAALGMTVIIVSGGIDLAAGTLSIWDRYCYLLHKLVHSSSGRFVPYSIAFSSYLALEAEFGDLDLNR